ncbi:MAG: hypothetical protein JJ840_08495 [Prochlorococcus marinus CUG1431]|uniref:Lipoprotein n=1 Tax=Prochlorococcus marinus CUG1433 TaxID=2774506 RepID=A0A9D9BUY3_PROMR|nr:hypothetical protein [Prochlorococcus marinus CUG1433]MBO6981386.1 hypothetical protein [Prochlorococcus marinus CUG1431]
MRKNSAFLTLILLFASVFDISAAYAGAYQSTCPAKKFAKIEADIRKNFKPRRNLKKNGPPDTVERRIEKAFKECRVPIQITGEEIISPDVSIPVTRVTSWIKSGYSNRRVNTGVTTTIIFGPIGALGFLGKKHRYSFIVKGFDADGKQATIQIDLFKKPDIERLTQELLLVTDLTMGEKRSIDKIRKIESEGFDSSLKEEEEEIRMEPLRKSDEMRLELEKKQNYMP